ncbi:metallophosphoesterase family protein [Botryobacter ruber]|uniref:metallophosphoesterase family protein n=1 Tax=Botryobacter ruber TaxID=2171629 RepID=UPI000E0CBC38|nr:metallophosphoesterase [Botryobacter ruber]
MNRKTFLQLTGAALTLSACAPSGLTSTSAATAKKRSLRVVHLTDVHLQPGGPSAKGFERALHAAQSLNPKPDLILNGGDSIFDSLNKDKAKTREQWDLWHRVLKSENSLPVVSCIGNHDVWGWGRKKDKAVTEDKRYGKQWAVESFGLDNRFYSFDKGGWHFVVLDSTHHTDQFNYMAKLDEQQFDWLQNDLQNVPSQTPVLVLSHIPLLTFSSQFFNGLKKDEPAKLEWERRALMHQDAWEIKNLFNEHKNVKLCLAGHLHMQEELNFLGVKYLVNGAVSGNWWKGDFHEFKPAFAVLDLFADGSSSHEWIAY